MKKKLIALILMSALLVTTGCNRNKTQGGSSDPSVLGDDETGFGNSLAEEGAYDGYFEEETTEEDFTVTCVSGTEGCYVYENGVITFTDVGMESVYSICGQLKGSIVIDTGDDYKFDLELTGFSMVSERANPITVLSGDEVSIKAKKDTENYIYDVRDPVDDGDDTVYSAAVYSLVDLEISGKGNLTVIAENNNGIHTKDDLQVKNLNLTVSCVDNALKGNDGVELEEARAKLVATEGDCVKTTNSDISDKGNQRGIISIYGGTYHLYAACDGLDAAYDVVIDGESTELNIYTDKYSNYSEQLTAVSENLYYIRFNYSNYSYSVKYYNSDDDFLWVNAEHHSTVSGGGGGYYYYSFPRNEDYSKLQFFMYSSDMEQGQDDEYVVASDYIALSDAYDTIALVARGNYIYYDWTNYTTTVSNGGPGGPGGMGPGGMNDGNTDKGDHSTKGIKAANEITVNNGVLNVKSYDDALHANNDTALENGQSPKGNVTVNGGTLTLYSNDDGMHADGTLTVSGGDINVINSYEGVEGYKVQLMGGNVRIVAKDDGVNATATNGTSITVGGGTLYVYCNGDGIDSNSTASYSGIAFTGGRTLIISTSGGNSAIDTEAGYSYSGGSVVAIMPRGGMSNEATHCQSFGSIGKSAGLSLSKGDYLVCNIGGDKLTLKMPASVSGYVITLGDSDASVAKKSSASHELAEGEFVWE